MTEAFKKCLPFTLKFEGGVSNHPNDPGGLTKWGITDSVYRNWRKLKGLPAQSVLHMTKEEMEKIYYERYWVPAGCEPLAYPADLVLFDTAVNMGVQTAKNMLKECQKEKLTPKDLAKALLNLREKRYHFLVQRNPKLKVFLKGWLNRVNALRRIIESS